MSRTTPKIAPSCGGSRPHLIHDSLSHVSQLPKRHLDRFSRFVYTAGRLSELLNGPDFRQNCPFPWGMWTRLIHGFMVRCTVVLEQYGTLVLPPYAVTIGSAVFAGHTNVTNIRTHTSTYRQTDRQITLLCL